MSATKNRNSRSSSARWPSSTLAAHHHGRRDVGGDDVALRANSRESCFGRKPSARSYVKDAHTRCDMGGTQQKGHKIGRHMRESAIVFRRRLILEGEFLWHARLLF